MADPQETPRRRLLFRVALVAVVAEFLVLFGPSLARIQLPDLRGLLPGRNPDLRGFLPGRNPYLRDIERKSFVKAPLAQSAYLRNIVEPITMIRGPRQGDSDWVWMGVVFEDAKHVEWEATYIDTAYPADGPVHHTLMLGKKKVPARGTEERAFLGLLQRWYAQDAEAQKLTDPRFEHPAPYTLTEQQQGKAVAAAIMRVLLERN